MTITWPAPALGHRERRDAHRPGALHDHVVTPCDARALDPVNGRDQRAPGADHRFGGQIVGQFENRRARPQIVKIRIPAEEMRRLIAPIPDPVGASMRAARGLAFLRAVVALAARGRGIPRHAVAQLQGLAIPIRLHAVAELFDAAHSLVAENDRQRNRQLAFPQMHVGATDARHLGAHQHRARLRPRGQRIVAELQRGFEAFENGGAGGDHGEE